MAYDVQTTAHTRLDMRPLMQNVRIDGNQPDDIETRMDQEAARHWHVDLAAIDRGDDGSTVLAARIEGGGVTLAGMPAQPPVEALADTFLVRVGPRCDIQEFGWRTEAKPEIARDQQVLLAGLGWLAPRDDESRWTGTLLDAMGRYNVGFAFDGERVRGRMADYEESFGRSTGDVDASFGIVQSSIEVEVVPGQWFGSLSTRRSLALSLHEQPVGTVEGSVVATGAEPSAWEPQVSLDDEGWRWGLLLDRPSPRETASVRTKAQEALVGVSVGDAVAQYLALVHEGHGTSETVALLTDWLRANPDGAALLVEQLRAGAFAGERSGRAGLFLALGKAQTPQAADALVSILEGSSDAMSDKVSAAMALSKIESPTDAMVDAVVAVAEHGDTGPLARGSLQMSLGAFASRNAERSPELAAKARGQIEGWLADPQDDRDLTNSLLAAGNAGHDGLVPSIEPYLDHEDPEVRQRAAKALRHMSPEEAYPRLGSQLEDESTAVRATAFEAMTEVTRSSGAVPPESVVSTAIAQLDTPVPQSERGAVIALLGAASRQGSETAKAALQDRFENERFSDRRDLQKLQELGRHNAPRWKAQ